MQRGFPGHLSLASCVPGECLWLKKSPRASAAGLLPQSPSLGQDAGGEGERCTSGPARALATSVLPAGASPVACGQRELQGVGRQVWLCLTGVGSGRNLAQRGPEWLGDRDLLGCRSPQPLLAARAPRRRTPGPRPRLSPLRGLPNDLRQRPHFDTLVSPSINKMASERLTLSPSP